jgi:predicted aldo/keto reductase-like oxidoreductase
MGRSEERLGKALRGRREDIFLMTKTIARDQKGAQLQLEESLRRLQTDYLDLWQFHSLMTPDDVDKTWGPDGAIQTALKAKKEGKVRHIGFTGHRNPRVHLKAIQEHHDVIETVQMPLSPVDPHFASFERIALPEALKQDLGIIAMKTMANGAVAEDRIATPAECHDYAWTLPVSTVVTGLDTVEQLEENVEQAIRFKPMPKGTVTKLLARTKGHEGPKFEAYKTDAPFEQWRVYPKEPVH